MGRTSSWVQPATCDDTALLPCDNDKGEPMNNALEIAHGHGQRLCAAVMARGKSNGQSSRDGARMTVAVGFDSVACCGGPRIWPFRSSTHVPAPSVGRVLFRAPRAKTPGKKVHTPFSGDLLAQLLGKSLIPQWWE